MHTKHSRIGVLGSVVLHSLLFASIGWIVHSDKPPVVTTTEEVTSISMEMMTALLEQPQIASAPEPEMHQEPIVEPELEQPEPALEAQPIEEPKPIEKPVEKPKEKSKEKPKPKKPKPKVATVEKNQQTKQSLVAKAIPNAVQGEKVQNVVEGNTASVQTQASRSEINQYLAQLQRTLQRRANNAYPQREKRLGKTGVVTLSFKLSSTGQIIEVNVIKSSGNKYLDDAAAKAAQGTQMSTPPPAGAPKSYTVPVSFSIY